jgi:hypothetical protein
VLAKAVAMARTLLRIDGDLSLSFAVVPPL